MPDPLRTRDTEPATVNTARATERARQTLIHTDAATPAAWEPLARLLLRAEGIASSYIEGVRAAIPDVVLAQIQPATAGGAASWVAANLAVIDSALAHAHGDAPLTAATLHDWHRQLMVGHSSLPAHLLGAFRPEQGWIGGTTPLDAALVTPPPELVPDLVDDLLDYVRLTDVDPVAQAAVSHAQFEIIHPYGDGNGRQGRVLVLWVLARRTGVRVLPPVSVRIAADPGAYLAELTNYRLGTADSWVRWFADTVTAATASVEATMSALQTLGTDWTGRLDHAGVRADAAARRLLTHLALLPVLTSTLVAQRLGVTERAARTAITTLAGQGILVPLPAGHGAAGRHRRWHVPEVTDLVIR